MVRRVGLHDFHVGGIGNHLLVVSAVAGTGVEILSVRCVGSVCTGCRTTDMFAASHSRLDRILAWA